MFCYSTPDGPINVYSPDRTDSPCYDDLFRYAWRIAESPFMSWFTNLSAVCDWIRTQPFVPDVGGFNDCRCTGGNQRLRVWPGLDGSPQGLNCWEAVAHYVGGCLRFGFPWREGYRASAVRIIDDFTPFGGRHIFPTEEYVYADPYRYGQANTLLKVVDLDSVHSQQRLAALQRSNTEWYEHLLGAVHMVGGTVLKAYGLGGAADLMEGIEGDHLPDWAVTNPDRAKARKAGEEKAKAELAAKEKLAQKERALKAEEDQAKKDVLATAKKADLKTTVAASSEEFKQQKSLEPGTALAAKAANLKAASGRELASKDINALFAPV